MQSSSIALEARPQQHKRSRSAVLKSIVNPGSKKSEDQKRAISTSPTKKQIPEPALSGSGGFDFAFAGNASSKAPLGELVNHNDRQSSTRYSKMDREENTSPLKSLHKKNKSAVSLKSLTRRDKSKDRNREKIEHKKADARKSCDEGSPRKSKSSGLSAFLSKSKSSKNLRKEEVDVFDKENRLPPGSADSDSQPPPIWAQFATAQSEQPRGRSASRHNTTTNDESGRYYLQEISPPKGQNFENRPALAKTRSGPSESPAQNLSDTFALLQRKSSSSSDPHKTKQTQHSIQNGRGKRESNSKPSTSKVMAAIAAFNGKNQSTPSSPTKATKQDPVAVDMAFEAMLESRNAPNDVREKMRRLDTTMKSEFIRQNKSSTNLADLSHEHEKIGSGKRSRTDDGISQVEAPQEQISPKKTRPRSFTLTGSKDSSPTKKQKSGRLVSHSRNKSADVPRSVSKSSSNETGGASGLFSRTPKAPVPGDFINYIRKVQNPQDFEIARLQKLRQLLRNEAVAWIESFIEQGGMDEIVSFLHRIIEVEWREEHEDHLLHHTLDCLRALLTTTLALDRLTAKVPTLFPCLLNLLFTMGDDRKAPAEFTTRNLIFAIIFAYLSASPTPDRARTLLAYLADPKAPESERPVAFIADMHRSRPYRRWCTEASNVTKEVFWIFLHSFNVIPYPTLPTTLSPGASFQQQWYPAPRPPVPAAPYVGGVEWDATTYLASHLDVLNGLIACLPTAAERNQLRTELRDSGWEKVMGGSLRTCKEKFYGGVHAGLGTFIGAGRDDEWDIKPVREGPQRERSASPKKSPVKKKDQPPQIEALPKLEIRNGGVGDWI